MKIGIISDSHDRVDLLGVVFKELEKKQVEMVCHLGDWVAPFSFNEVDSLAKDIGVPVKGVIGNNDGDVYKIVRKIEDEWQMEISQHTLMIELENKGIVLYHGTDKRITDALVRCGLYDVVLVGHTHRQRNEKVGEVLVVNPGSVGALNPGGKSELAIYDSESNQAELLSLS